MIDEMLLASLELPPDADAAAIRSRYRVLARELHPDLNGEDSVKVRRFVTVHGAYEALRQRGRA